MLKCTAFSDWEGIPGSVVVSLIKGVKRRHRLALAALSAGVLFMVACTVGSPTPTAITFPDTPTPIVFPPTPTAITFPPTPTPFVFPSVSPDPTNTPTVPTVSPTGSVSPEPTVVDSTPTLTPTSVPATPSSIPPTPTTAVPVPLTTTEIARAVMPSVVRISANTGAGQSSGTGIVFDDEGTIITNWHVIEGALSISVTKPDQTVVLAELYRSDPQKDIALLTVSNTTGLVPAVFGDADSLNVGDDVVAVGHALGLVGPPSISKGVISALDRALSNGVNGQLNGLIQTDAAINSGNSGGPLVNTYAEVIGVNTAKLSTGDRVGFAINIDSALETVEALIALGPIPEPGFLGVSGRNLTQPQAANLGLPVVGGYIVQTVGDNTPADEAGIIEGDVIVQMDTTVVRNEGEFTIFLQTHPAGSEVRIFIWRLVTGSGWEPVVIDVILGEQE